MSLQQLYETWAPADAVWSRWAKPVLFASPGLPALPDASAPPPPLAAEPSGPRGWRAGARLDPQAAYVVDLPGAASVEAGLALARAGYRPVPLYNTTRHPAAVVEVDAILSRLAAGADELAALGIPPEAPPAFLLDARRLAPAASAAPGRFDNRWVVFPQDFPSASFLRSRGIQRVVVVQEGEGEPALDLAHVLLRYRQAGLEIDRQPPDLTAAPQPIEVRRPSLFRSVFYRALTLSGLRRNSAGGFGAVIPIAAAGHRYG
jgi:hypothetical protein